MTLAQALAHGLTCCEEVTRNHQAEPCGRVAVAVVDHPGSDRVEPGVWPVCKRHIERRRNVLAPLGTVLALAWEQGMRHESEHLDWFGQFCPMCAKGKCNPYAKENA
mgnify:CR=1 FL=1